MSNSWSFEKSYDIFAKVNFYGRFILKSCKKLNKWVASCILEVNPFVVPSSKGDSCIGKYVYAVLEYQTSKT